MIACVKRLFDELVELDVTAKCGGQIMFWDGRMSRVCLYFFLTASDSIVLRASDPNHDLRSGLVFRRIGPFC